MFSVCLTQRLNLFEMSGLELGNICWGKPRLSCRLKLRVEPNICAIARAPSPAEGPLCWPVVAQAPGVCAHQSEQEMMRFHCERELPRSRTCTGGRQEPYLRLLSFALLFNPVFCGCGRIRVCRDELKGGGGCSRCFQ